MNWMKERDLLIAQTVAFVQSVTGKTPDLDRPAAVETTAIQTTAIPATMAVNVEAALEPAAAAAILPEATPQPKTSAPPRKPPPVTRDAAPSDFRSEIKARVANFRAHQARFTREREEYCRTTLDKVRATLGEDTEPSQAAE